MQGKFPSEAAERFQVRMPDGLRDRIKAAADANNRSMNAEIISTLMEAYPPNAALDEIAEEISGILNDIGNEPQNYGPDRFSRLRSALQDARASVDHIFDLMNDHSDEDRED